MSKRLLLTIIVSALFSTGCDKIEYALYQFNRVIDSSATELLEPVTIKTEKASIDVVMLQADFYLPWALTALPDNTFLVTEKPGNLYRFNPVNMEKKRVRGLPATKKWGQGGFMDIVLHPDYKQNNWVYFSYVGLIEGGLAATRVARAKLVNNTLENVDVLFTAEPAVKSGAHFGSALAFDDQGYLFITSGERGQRSAVQDLSTHLGKIIRLHDDGRIPKDNPFVEVGGAMAQIYSYGHRNPQGIGIEPISREVWSVEHGPKGGDEVNVIRAGANYGWPVISMGKEYATGKEIGEGVSKPGMESPHYFYVPSIATSSLEFYTGSAFPNWKNNLFVGALSFTHINRLEITQGEITHEERLLKDLNKRIRDVEEGADGLLYVLTDDGQILQLKPTPTL